MDELADPLELAGLTCARCERVAPITRGELDDRGQAGASGEHLLPVIVAPPGWLHDEDDLLVCLACSTEAEREEHYGQLDGAERVVAAVLEEAGGPPADVTLEELRGAPADDDDDDESESRSPV